jgi:hypothetical protein
MAKGLGVGFLDLVAEFLQGPLGLATRVVVLAKELKAKVGADVESINDGTRGGE